MAKRRFKLINAGGTFVETNDLTAAVTWANVPDANITQSSVTQHQAALSITESQISDLGAYLLDAPSDGSTYGRKDGAWAVVAGGATTFAGLTDTDTTGLLTGDFTYWSGTDWVPTAGLMTFTLGTPDELQIDADVNILNTNDLFIGDHLQIQTINGGVPGGSGTTHFKNGVGDNIISLFDTDGGVVQLENDKLRLVDQRLALWGGGERYEIYSDLTTQHLNIRAESLLNDMGIHSQFPLILTSRGRDSLTIPADSTNIWTAQYSGSFSTVLMTNNEDQNGYPVANMLSIAGAYNNPTTAADPGDSFMRVNSISFDTATALYYADEHFGDTDCGFLWDAATVGDVLLTHQGADRTRWAHWEITGITDNTGWWTISVNLLNRGTATGFRNGDDVITTLIPMTGVDAAVSGGFLKLDASNGPLTAALAGVRFTAAGALGVRADAGLIVDSSVHAGIYLNATTGTADENNWGIDATTGGLFRITTSTDADGAGNTFFQASRTGTTVDDIALNATTITVTGALAATSFGGITEANLLDKSATETVSGLYTFSTDILAESGFSVQGTATDQGQVGQVGFADVTSGVARFGSYNWDTASWAPTGMYGSTLTFRIGTTEIMGLSSGAVNITGALTATSYGGITEANLLDKSATETVSGSWTFSSTLGVGGGINMGNALDIGGTSPRVNFLETGGTADEQNWRILGNGSQLLFATMNDLETVAENWLTVDRTGTNVDQVTVSVGGSTGVAAFDAGAVALYYAGARRFGTTSSGIDVRGSLNNDPTTGGTQNAQINMSNNGGTEIGDITYNSTDSMYIRNLVHGGRVLIQGQEAAAGTTRGLIVADPDADVKLYYQGGEKIATLINGGFINGSVFIAERASAATDVAGRGQLWVKNTTPCQLWFTDDAGTDTQIV